MSRISLVSTNHDVWGKKIININNTENGRNITITFYHKTDHNNAFDSLKSGIKSGALQDDHVFVHFSVLFVVSVLFQFPDLCLQVVDVFSAGF